MAGGRLDCTSSLLSGALQFQEVRYMYQHKRRKYLHAKVLFRSLKEGNPMPVPQLQRRDGSPSFTRKILGSKF